MWIFFKVVYPDKEDDVLIYYSSSLSPGESATLAERERERQMALLSAAVVRGHLPSVAAKEGRRVVRAHSNMTSANGFWILTFVRNLY